MRLVLLVKLVRLARLGQLVLLVVKELVLELVIQVFLVFQVAQ